MVGVIELSGRLPGAIAFAGPWTNASLAAAPGPMTIEVVGEPVVSLVVTTLNVFPR